MAIIKFTSAAMIAALALAPYNTARGGGLQAGSEGCVTCIDDDCVYVQGDGSWRCYDDGVNCIPGSSCTWSSGGCFLAGTLVDTPRGPVPIERLSVGDEVHTLDGEGRLTLATVTRTYRTIASDHLLINGRLGVTKNHPFMVSGQWLNVGELAAGASMGDVRGLGQPVNSVQFVDRSVRVYNIEVDGNHTFLVDGILVHNKVTPGEG